MKDIDTNEIRKMIEDRKMTYQPVPAIVADLCNEVDRLRSQLFNAQLAVLKEGMEADRLRGQLAAYTGKCSGDCHEQDNEVAKLTAEVARLREKCGEKVCGKCGKPSEDEISDNDKSITDDVSWEKNARDRFLSVYGATIAVQWATHVREGRGLDDASIKRFVSEARALAQWTEEVQHV